MKVWMYNSALLAKAIKDSIKKNMCIKELNNFDTSL